MNTLETTCPFCNARVAASAPRMTCPRCGEPFAVSADVTPAPGISIGLSPNISTGLLPSPTAVERPRPVRSNRLVAGIILGVMMLAAGASLTYALLTQDVRRKHDRAITKRPSRRPALDPLLPDELPKKELPPHEAVAPEQLAALRYLPPQTGVVAGLHAREMLDSAVGKQLSSRELKIDRFSLRLDSIRESLGIPAEEIDHAVIGVVVRDGELVDATPPIHFVVRTRTPIDADKLRTKLEAGKPRQEKTPNGGKRTVYPVSVQKLPMYLWHADDKTIVLGVFTRLELVPETPANDLQHLPAPLREAIAKRLVKGQSLWVAGHASDWTKTWVPTLLGMFEGLPLAKQIDKVDTFAIGVVPDRPMTVDAAFHCRDEATAKLLEEKELMPRAKESKQFGHSREGEWLKAQWKVELGK